MNGEARLAEVSANIRANIVGVLRVFAAPGEQ